MHKKSVELLNRAIGDELTAVHQYMYFHFHCDDQGYGLLATLFRRTAIAEMLHIEQLAERILFLKGAIKLVSSAPVMEVHDVKGMLDKARGMEAEAVAVYNKWANECAANADSVTKKIFEALVADEEGHYAEFDEEMDNLERYGDQYLALQTIERSKARAAVPPAG